MVRSLLLSKGGKRMGERVGVSHNTVEALMSRSWSGMGYNGLEPLEAVLVSGKISLRCRCESLLIISAHGGGGCGELVDQILSPRPSIPYAWTRYLLSGPWKKRRQRPFSYSTSSASLYPP